MRSFFAAFAVLVGACGDNLGGVGGDDGGQVAVPTFGPPVSQGEFLFLLQPPLAVGDFTGDGKPDVAYVQSTEVTFLGLLIDKTATGATVPQFERGGPGQITGISSVASGDLDGDGIPDLVVTSCCEILGGKDVAVTRVEYSRASALALPTVGFQPVFAAIGDLDGDGAPDVAVGDRTGDSFSVFLNAGAAMKPAIDVPALHAATAMAIGDFNGDGLGDIALLHGKTATVTVLLNTTQKGSATLTFAAGVDFATAQQASRVEIDDVDGDGKADIVVGTGAGTFSVFLNTAASRAAQPSFTTHDVTIGDGSRFARLVDLNGDGKLDVLAMTGTGVAIAVNTATGATPRWSDPIEVDASSAVREGNYAGTMNVGAADFNGDGKVDLVVSNVSPQNAQADTISILLAQ